MKNKYTIFLLAIFAVIGTTNYVYAVDNTKTTIPTIERKGPVNTKIEPIIVGAVSSIKGNIITINSSLGNTPIKEIAKNTSKESPSKIYMVDVSNAIYDQRGGNTSTLADIVIGNRIAVEGIVTGTNIKALKVHNLSIGSDLEKSKSEIKGEGLQVKAQEEGSGVAVEDNSGKIEVRLSFWGQIGNFFSKIFGKNK